MAFVIATAWGIRGDVTPYVGIGAELRRRGHEVALLSNPAFEALAQDAGLSFVPVGTADQYDALVEDPGLWDRQTHVTRGVEHLLPTVEGFYRAVAGAHRPGETVLLASRPGAWIAREKLDIPTVALLVSPGALSRLDPPHPGRPFPSWANRIVRSQGGLRLLHSLKARLAWLGARLGRSPFSGSQWRFLAEVRRVRALAGLPQQPASADALRAALVVGLWPSWFSPPQRDWPAGMRLAGFPFHPRPPARNADPVGDEDSRPVVFLRGSAAAHQRAFFEEAVQCCRLLGRPGVIVTPHADDVPPGLPPTVRHVPFAPLGELFLHARAAVHHGGVGTTAYAFAAGIPQVVVPIVADQFDLGYRMERLGVGSMLSEEPVTADRLARELRRLCGSESVRRRCEAVRDEVDPEAGCSRAADWIEEVIASLIQRSGRPRVAV